MKVALHLFLLRADTYMTLKYLQQKEKIRDDIKQMGYLKAIFSILYIIVISYAVYSLLMRKILDNQYGQKGEVYKSFNLISWWSGKLGLHTRI